MSKLNAVSYFRPSINTNAPLGNYCNDLLSSEHIAIGSANNLILQPDFTSSLLPLLNGYQANLVRHCKAIKSLDGSTIACSYLSILQSIGDAVVSNLEILSQVADALDQGRDNPEYSAAKETFIVVIADLITSYTIMGDDSYSMVQTLKQKFERFSQILDDIATQATNIKAAINGLRSQGAGNAGSYMDEVNMLKEELDKLNTEIAKGATTKIFDSIMFGLSTSACLMGGGLEPEMVIGAVVGIVGEGGSITEFEQQQQQMFNQQTELVSAIRKAVVKAETKHIEYGMLSVSYASSQRLNTNLTIQLKSVHNILDLLKNWPVQLNSFSNKIGTRTPPDFFKTQVQEGIDYWKDIQQICSRNLDILAQSHSTSIQVSFQ